MKALKIMIVMLVLIMSVGAVCAAETITDDAMGDDSQKISKTVGENFYMAGEFSFTNLTDEIESAGDSLDLTQDYVFDNETDNKNGIAISRDNFVLNGNGHTIDARNQSRIFNITADNVTINNLIFTGGNAEKGGAIWANGKITLNNVTFTDNYASEYGGAVMLEDHAILNCYNSVFEDNYADMGSSVLTRQSNLNIYNSVLSSKRFNRYSQIASFVLSNIDLENVTFINSTSSYASAFYLERSEASIVNSHFINLKANITAGAIGVKSNSTLHVKNCEFINTTSSKNGGAIYADVSSDFSTGGRMGHVYIYDTVFKDTSSGFGGAILQLSGSLLLENTEFINTHAAYNGGAVYITFGGGDIINCTFDSCDVELIEDYPTYGGALYINLMGNLLVDNSKFFNNQASAGSAIYAYDSTYEIKHSVFENNTNPIYSVFDNYRTNIDKSNVFTNDDNVSTNNTYFKTIMTGQGQQITLINNTINVTTIPSRFDLRDWKWVSPVRNQGRMGACWTFGIIGALESALIKAAGITTDFSENNMQDTMLRYSIYGDKRLDEGGSNTVASGYLLSWLGTFPQNEDTFDELGKISPVITSENGIHLQDVMLIPNNEIPNGTQLKLAIMKYGSLDGVYCSDEDYYNADTYAHYVDYGEITPDHAISIVGWDDNFPKEKFLITPPGDGAWIIKNSWGSEWGDNGYFYISYYDKTFLQCTPYGFDGHATAMIIENTEPYNKNYQYDLEWNGEFLPSPGNASYYNVFEAIDDDLIAAVGTYFNQSGADYKVEIFVNDELKLTQTGVSPYLGYHTIKLNEYIPIKKGDVFKAIMTSNTIPYINLDTIRVHYTENLSFVSMDGENWEDAYKSEKIACLKVYTVAADSRLNTTITADSSMVVLVSDLSNASSRFNLTLVSDGENLANKTIAITFNGETGEFMTDENGMISYVIPLVNAGNYALEMEFAGDAMYGPSNASSAVSVVKGQSKIFLRNALYFVLQDKIVNVTLWDANNSPVAGKKVHITIGDSTWSGETDEMGTAHIRVGIGFGVHAATVHFDGDDEYAASNRSGYVRVIKETPSLMVRGADTQFKSTDPIKIVKVYLWDRNSKPLPAGSKVAIKINGKTYAGNTFMDGIAYINIPIDKAGAYDAKAVYGGNSAYNAVTRNIKIRIV